MTLILQIILRQVTRIGLAVGLGHRADDSYMTHQGVLTKRARGDALVAVALVVRRPRRNAFLRITVRANLEKVLL